MNASFLPRNSSHNESSISRRPRILHRISVRSQSPAPSRLVPRDNKDHETPDNELGDYKRGLQRRIRATQATHNDWYEAINNDAHLQDVIRQERVSLAKYERDQVAAFERQKYEEAQRQQLEAHQTRLAEEAERRKYEEERLQSERNEAEAARLARLAAEAEEQRRLREEEERRRRERLRECAICLDSRDMSMMLQVICSHWYCHEHLRGCFPSALPDALTHYFIDAFEIAWTSKTPFQCCQQVISPDAFSEVISQPFRARYNLWLLERTTPNPVYCSNRSCGVFLPPSQAEGPDAFTCIACRTSTCRHCRSASHPHGECAADVDTQRARALAAMRGWKACPTCASMVERSSGCLHMTCRCGTDFCYRCGQLYRLCGGTCQS